MQNFVFLDFIAAGKNLISILNIFLWRGRLLIVFIGYRKWARDHFRIKNDPESGFQIQFLKIHFGEAIFGEIRLYFQSCSFWYFNMKKIPILLSLFRTKLNNN